jgi:hypothetical protein
MRQALYGWCAGSDCARSNTAADFENKLNSLLSKAGLIIQYDLVGRTLLEQLLPLRLQALRRHEAEIASR